MADAAREFTINTDKNNAIKSYSVLDKGRNQSTGIHLKKRWDTDPNIPLTSLSKTLETWTEKAPIAVRPYSDEGWKTAAIEKLAPIANEIRKLQKSIIAQKQSLAKRRSDWIKPPKDYDHTKAAEIRTYLRGLSAAEVIRRVNEDPEIASVILENPVTIAGANDTGIVKNLRRNAMLYNLTKTYASQTSKKPSIDSPVAYGVDEDASKSYAEKSLNNLENAEEHTNTMSKVLTQVINYYAIAAGISPTEAFKSIGLDS